MNKVRAPMTTSKPVRLLLVDDNEYNRDFLSRRLKRQGYGVTTADNGKTALDLVEPANSSISCCWISRCRSSADWTSFKRSRKRFRPSELPVIMITAQQESSVIVSRFRSRSK